MSLSSPDPLSELGAGLLEAACIVVVLSGIAVVVVSSDTFDSGGTSELSEAITKG